MDNGQPATPKETRQREALAGWKHKNSRSKGSGTSHPEDKRVSPRSQKRASLPQGSRSWSHLSLKSGRDSAAEIHREEHGRPGRGALQRGRVMGRRAGQRDGGEGSCATVYILRLKTSVGTFSLKKKKTNAWNT